MSAAKLKINELRLRVPGLSRYQARRLGEIVAERLAKHTPADNRQARVIPSMNIRVHSNEGRSVEQMANEIAGSIRHSLR